MITNILHLVGGLCSLKIVIRVLITAVQEGNVTGFENHLGIAHWTQCYSEIRTRALC